MERAAGTRVCIRCGMRWGRVVGLRVYCDTQLLATILDEIERQGVAEAGLAPIGESTGASRPFAPQPG